MKIVVVGGVAGGLSFAARARRLDESAEIVVFEKGPYPSFSNCGLPYHLGGEIPMREALLLNSPQSLHDKLNLDVRVNHEVTALDASEKTVTVRPADGPEFQETYDYLVLSPGARAARPPIPGLDLPQVHALRTVDDVTRLVELVETGGVAGGMSADMAGGAEATVGETPADAAGTADAETGVGAKNAVVIGGGFIGIEAAEALAKRGLHTTIVEGSSHVMPPLDVEIANLVTGALGSLGVQVLADTLVKSIRSVAVGQSRMHEELAVSRATHETPTRKRAKTGNTPGSALMITLSNGKKLPADLVVLAAGVTPNTEPFIAAGAVADQRGYLKIDKRGRTNLTDVFALGDATTQVTAVTGETRPVALAGPTNRAGRLIADFICDPERAQPLPRPLSTSIFRVGSMTVAMTGANRAELERAEVAFRTIHTHPTDHGTFLPGAQPMQLLMHFEADSGRILGAQGIGGNGVDKRIDVIATAMRAGLRAPDLLELDLAYAPPYGAAKDPVNFLGYVAQNVLDGHLELWYADQVEQLADAGAVLVDVRRLPEFHAGHLRGARCLPLEELRGRLAELREWLSAAGSLGDSVYLCDDTGANAWLAARILAGNGINAKVLSGGVNTVFAYHFQNPGQVLEM